MNNDKIGYFPKEEELTLQEQIEKGIVKIVKTSELNEFKKGLEFLMDDNERLKQKESEYLETIDNQVIAIADCKACEKKVAALEKELEELKKPLPIESMTEFIGKLKGYDNEKVEY